jgi:hypothetical protein
MKKPALGGLGEVEVFRTAPVEAGCGGLALACYAKLLSSACSCLSFCDSASRWLN